MKRKELCNNHQAETYLNENKPFDTNVNKTNQSETYVSVNEAQKNPLYWNIVKTAMEEQAAIVLQRSFRHFFKLMGSLLLQFLKMFIFHQLLKNHFQE